MRNKFLIVGGLAVLIVVMVQLQISSKVPTALRGQSFKTLLNEPYNQVCGDFDPCISECKCYDVMLDMGDGTSMPSTECQVEARNPPLSQASCGADYSQCGYWMMDGLAQNGQSYCQCIWFEDPTLCTSGTTGGDSGTTTGGDGGTTTGGDSGTTTGGDTGSDTGGDGGTTTGGDTGSTTGGDGGTTTGGDTGTDGGYQPTDSGGDGGQPQDPCANINCNDGNACTSDSCSNGVCKNTPLDCNDNNSCTADSCSGGSCVNTPKNCNDNNSCTSDSCVSGQCVNTKIESPECGVCENEPVCQEFSQPCFVSTPNAVDANGCITQCGTCMLHPLPPYNPQNPQNPRCPTPICAPIPEGCSAKDSGVDGDGCPIDPCGYTCPEEPECSDPPPECENVEKYHLDGNPDCKQNGEDACGCPSFDCAITGSVQCCSSENVCTVFEVNTRYGEDEEQYWAETDWIMDIASQMDKFDESASQAEKQAFCENLGNQNPRPQPPSTPQTDGGADSGEGEEVQCPTPPECSPLGEGCSYTNIPKDSNNCVTGCGELVCEEVKPAPESECDPVSCAAPPEGCKYDITAKVEDCGCPPLVCESEESGGATGADSGGSTSGDEGTSSAPDAGTTSSSATSSSKSIIAVDPNIPTSSSSAQSVLSSQAPAICGDGKVNQSFEQCDDGNFTDYDGCSSVCQQETRAPTGGNTNTSTTQTTAPTATTRNTRSNTPPICGDGLLQYGEQCDDSNTSNGDGCSASCTLETGTQPVCGDTILTIGEECDYGPANANKPNFCRSNCLVPVCGDGIVDDRLNEQCDDGNVRSNDGCSTTCLIEKQPTLVAVSNEFCGNGQLEVGEECDDGNTIGNDGCSAYCTIREDGIPSRPSLVAAQAFCGNGVLEAGEECDDGNLKENDGCSRYCEIIESSSSSVPTEVAGEFITQNFRPSAQQIGDTSSSAAPSYVHFPQFSGLQNSQQLAQMYQNSQLPMAQLQPLIQGRAPVGDTGPAAVAVMGAGAAAGMSWIRRKKKK